MAIDTGAVDRALGAIGTTFRLTRLYPPSHPAVLEAMRQITGALPALAALGTVEWKIGATGLLWHGQHLLPRNTQVAELAGLLFARGVRAIQVNPGVTSEHWLGLFGVAVGNVSPDDAVLGRITVMLGRRASQRLSASRVLGEVAPAAAAPSPPPISPALESPSPPARESSAFRLEALPADLEARRAVVALQAASAADEQRATIEQLRRLTPALVALRDIGAIAEVVLMSPGAVTHGFNQNERYVGCAITGTTATTVHATAPANGSIAPPGYYLLFIVDHDRVPSVAKWIRLTP